MKNKIVLILSFLAAGSVLASEHEVIECTTRKKDAFEAYAKVGQKYCKVLLDAQGESFGSWIQSSTSCVKATQNTAGLFTLLFSEAEGSGSYLYTLYNLDKNRVGYIRHLSRAPRDVNQPIDPRSGTVMEVTCLKVKMKFND